jgi:hypothetical protein
MQAAQIAMPRANILESPIRFSFIDTAARALFAPPKGVAQLKA